MRDDAVQIPRAGCATLRALVQRQLARTREHAEEARRERDLRQAELDQGRLTITMLEATIESLEAIDGALDLERITAHPDPAL